MLIVSDGNYKAPPNSYLNADARVNGDLNVPDEIVESIPFTMTRNVFHFICPFYYDNKYVPFCMTNYIPL